MLAALREYKNQRFACSAPSQIRVCSPGFDALCPCASSSTHPGAAVAAPPRTRRRFLLRTPVTPARIKEFNLYTVGAGGAVLFEGDWDALVVDGGGSGRGDGRDGGDACRAFENLGEHDWPHCHRCFLYVARTRARRRGRRFRQADGGAARGPAQRRSGSKVDHTNS